MLPLYDWLQVWQWRRSPLYHLPAASCLLERSLFLDKLFWNILLHNIQYSIFRNVLQLQAITAPTDFSLIYPNLRINLPRVIWSCRFLLCLYFKEAWTRSARAPDCVVLSKVPSLSWSPWLGVELKRALPPGSTAEWVCVCLNHVSMPLRTRSLKTVWSTRSCQHNHPHLLWKARGQPDFYNPASANYSLLVYWLKDTRPLCLWQRGLTVGGGSKTEPPQDKTGGIAVGLWLQLHGIT